MKYIDLVLDHGSKEWLDYRNKSVTATNFCIIATGKSLFDSKDVNDLIYNKKNNIQVEVNEYMRRGTELEPVLLEKFNNKHDLLCAPKVVALKGNPNIMASLDGLDILSDNIIVELKYTTREDIEELEAYYKYQVIHQMFCTKAETGYLAIYQDVGKDELVEHIFKYDAKTLDDIITYDQWLDLCNDFLTKLNAELDNEMLSNLDKYFILKQEADNLEKQMEELKKNFKEGVYNNYIIKPVNKTTTQYSKYIKDNNILLSNDYKTTTTYLKVSKKDE